MTSQLEQRGRAAGVYYGADDLMDTTFPEPRWAVPGLLPEGLTLLGGAPKLGKSWLCLGLSIDIACGTPVLGKIPVDQGDVLYAALEDPPRRLKGRLRMILGDRPAPANLALVTSLPTLVETVELIGDWLDSHPDARLVVIDVLAKIRPTAPTSMSAYEADYAVLSRLKRLADQHRIALVVVTHLRKMHAEDVFDQISGSTGLTGAADTSVVAKRSRGENAAVLHVTGRDVLESEYAVTFNPADCRWTLDGDALAEAAHKARTLRAAEGLGDKSAEIIALVADHPAGIGPTAVGKAIGMTASNAGTYLQRLVDAGRIVQISRGLYSAVESVEAVESDEAHVLPFPQLPRFPRDGYGVDG